MHVYEDSWDFTEAQFAVHLDDIPKLAALLAKQPGTRWAWYRCEAMDATNHGDIVYLAVGPRCTYKEPPPFHPGPNVWHRMSVFKGWVDPESWICVPVAQLEERGLPKPEAVGSTPSGDAK